MKKRVFLVLAILLAAVAVGVQFYPFDREAPQVTISPAPGPYREVVRFSLSSEPGAELFYGLDGGEPMPFLGPVALRRDTKVSYFARDKAGNSSPMQIAAYAVNLDNEPPVTEAFPPGGSYDHPVSVRLSTEAGALIRYTTDGSQPGDGSLAYQDAIAVMQTTTLRFFATDAAGNREEAVTQVYGITIDRTRPVTLVTPSGGLFNGPVTVRLTAEEGSVIHYTTDGKSPSEKSPRYGNPLVLSATATLKFFAVDRSGNREDPRQESYVIDTQPPSVRADPPAGTFGRAVSVRLSASEPGEIRYEVGDRAPTLSSPVYRGPITVDNDTVLRAMAFDRAGNRSNPIAVSYVIDTTPPQSIARPPGGSYSGRIRVKIETSETADVFFTMDGSSPTRQSARYQGPLNVDRNTVLSFMAVDAVGNQGRTAVERYVLDDKAPATRAEPAGGMFAGPLDVALVSEDGAVIRYTTDGSEPGESAPVYRGPIRISKETVLRFAATDSSGNREATRSERYTFDTTPPSSSIDPAPGFYNRSISVALRAEKGGSIFYRTDERKDYAPYQGPFVLDRSAKVAFYAADASGNKETPQTAEYVIDSEPPATIPFPAPGEYNPPIVLELRSEEGAKIHYTLDGSSPTESSPAFGAPVSMREAFTVKFFAVDRAGNREAVQTAGYTVSSGLWRRNTNGVFIHPSVLDGDLLWLGGEEGLFKVDIESKRRKNYTVSDGLISNSVRAVAVDRLGFVWVGTDKGVSQFDGKGTWVTYDYSDGLPTNVVNCIVMDALDRIWFGTEKGLTVLADKAFRTMTTADGLPDNRVTAIAIDAAAVFWVGTEKGLWRYRGKDRRIFTTADGLPSNWVTSVAVDGRWGVWVGTKDQGVARFDGSRWVSYGPSEGMPARQIFVIAVDLADSKWFGTEKGVYKYNGRSFTPVAAPVYK